MYKISTIWSLTTLPNLLLCLSSNKSRKLTKPEETKCKHEIHTRRMVQTQHTRQRYTLIASSKTQHGYELSSKHNISTHCHTPNFDLIYHFAFASSAQLTVQTALI